MKIYEMETYLNSLKNKNISLDGKSGRLIRWAMGDKTLKLTLDSQDIVILAGDVAESMERIQVVEGGELVKVAPVPLIQRSGSKIEAILMDNIENIQKKPEYLEQAKEINANVKTLIDLAKTEVDYMKTIASFTAQSNPKSQ
ncbi:hypothetical protein GCM10027284_09090 [Cyclobacterium sediminis]